MAYSMTAYASQDVHLPSAIARWEIRSINHRYLELSFKLPAFFSELEYRLRDFIRKNLSRGKIDCLLKVDFVEKNKNELMIDLNLIEQLISASQDIIKRFPLATNISAFDILRWPSVVQSVESDLYNLKEPLYQSFVVTLEELIKSRAREGSKLAVCIQERLNKMHHYIHEIQRRLPEIQEIYRLKFYEKWNVLKLELDRERLEQSMIPLIQKIDISEELDRLAIHLVEINRILMEDKIIGRRLDFLMQELNREVNTLASKAVDSLTIQATIELKVLIEEMREQVQNLE